MQEPTYSICTIKTKNKLDIDRARTARDMNFTHDEIYMIGLRLILGDKPVHDLENSRRRE